MFLAEEPETEARTGDDDKWSECETMQKLISEEHDFSTCSINSTTDLDGNRYC